MQLPVMPPVEPMLARLSAEIPLGDGWLFEPKWDGFRALVFRDGDEVYIQSRDLKPLHRYFPELPPVLRAALPDRCVVDGEVVIVGPHGLDFDAMLLRIHPAESRIARLSGQSPASYVAWDLLALGDDDLRRKPFEERRARLETALGVPGRGIGVGPGVLAAVGPSVLPQAEVGPQAPAPLGVGPDAAAGRTQSTVHLTPATRDPAVAAEWFDRFEGAGLDGIVAKRRDGVYEPGKRAMVKVKHVRTADCAVAGFRWHRDGPGTLLGSLLLGLHDEAGVLHHVGVTSSFTMERRRALVAELAPLRDRALEGHPWAGWAEWEAAAAASGRRMPGATSRWNRGRDLSWEPLRVELVCEVAYDHLQRDRFRHATTFQRWRPDRRPEDCRYDQLEVTPPFELARIFGPR
jgi:ATP-dependent DNA ligase